MLLKSLNFPRYIMAIFCSILILGLAAPSQAQLLEQEKKSLIWGPLLGAIVPGAPQALDGDYKKGGLLFGYLLTGAAVMSGSQNKINEFWSGDSLHFHHLRDQMAIRDMGGSMVTHAMFLGSYDSFATRVKAYRKDGEYLFLPEEQNLTTIAKAPFQFSYLSRWTTWAPLLVSAAISYNHANESVGGQSSRLALRPVDGAAATYRSYVAGTGEEAFFRGYALPILYQNTGSFALANSLQALAFGYAHGSEPYFQIAAGLYFGWLTARNNYDLGESIFVHAWWDVFLMTAEYARTRGRTRDFDLRLPMFTATF